MAGSKKSLMDKFVTCSLIIEDIELLARNRCHGITYTVCVLKNCFKLLRTAVSSSTSRHIGHGADNKKVQSLVLNKYLE